METRDLSAEHEREAFAKRAAAYFDKHVECTSYTDDGSVERGQLLALRWGLSGDCVLVVKVDDYAPVIDYIALSRRIHQNESGAYVFDDD